MKLVGFRRMHPYILSDMANDKTVNGVIDTEKRTERGQKWIPQKVHYKLNYIGKHLKKFS